MHNVGVAFKNEHNDVARMRIIVTDLTRFTNPDIVCLAGIDPDTGLCVRPMLENGTKLDYFPFSGVKEHSIIPGSCLSGNFIPVVGAQPPHIEDHRSRGNVNVVESATGLAFEAVLEMTAHTSIQAAFGGRPNERCYSRQAAPALSIITLRLDSPASQFKLVLDDKYGPPKFKAHVTDADGYQLSWLPVTDLGFSDHVAKVRNDDPSLLKLNAFLRSQRKLYLRVGLSRPYAPTPERDGYWVQLNGIYSFPNFRRDLRIYD